MKCKTCGSETIAHIIKGSNICYCSNCLNNDRADEVMRMVFTNNAEDFFGAMHLTCDRCGKNIAFDEENVFHVGRRYIYCVDCVENVN